MRDLWTRWTALSGAVFCYWFGSQSLRPVLGIELTHAGASPTLTGLALAGYSALSLLFAIPLGRHLTTAHQRRFLCLATIGLAASSGVLLAATIPATLAVGIAINGACASATWLTLQSMISFAPGRIRQQQIGIFSLAWGVGLAFGPPLGALIFEHQGLVGVVVVSSGVCLSGWLFSLVGPAVDRRSSKPPAHEPMSRRPAVRSYASVPGVGAVLVASFVNMFVQAARIGFYPIYLVEAGISLTFVSGLLLINGVVTLGTRVLQPILLRWRSPMWLLHASGWVSILTFAVIPATVASDVALIVSAVLLGVGLGLNAPLSMIVLSDVTTPDQRTMVAALRTVSNRAAQLIQPAIFGACAALVGLGPAFVATGLALAGLTLWGSRDFSPAVARVD